MTEDNHDQDLEVGIPEHLRVKRSYTMTEAALQQRRQAASQPRPNAEGHRNNWKHGLYAKNFANKIRPCKSTCNHFPCSLVEEGATEPGGDCLDKAEVLQLFRAIHDAVANKRFDDFSEVAALSIANNIKILEMLQEDIMRDGTLCRRETPTANGLKTEYVLHPALLALPKLTADLGITPAECLITERSRNKATTEEKGVKTLAELLANAGKNLQKSTDGE